MAPPNAVLELLKAHRSIRKFRDEPVAEEDLRAAIEAGQMASTSSAVQAYGVLRVRDPEVRAELVRLTGDQPMVAACGAFLVVFGDTRRHRLAAARMGHRYDARLEAFLVAVIDASLFAQNAVVALESMGYGVCYVGGLRNHPEEVDRLLGLPEGVHPLFGLCVGRPAEEPSRRPRLPLEAILFEGRYPDDAAILAQLDRYDADYAAYLASRGAQPAAWSERMGGKFSRPERESLSAYHRRKGGRFD